MSEIIEQIAVERRLIREDTVQPFDIYYRSADGKMKPYCIGGERIGQDVLDTVRECKIEYLYINRKDRNEFRQYVETHLPGILADKTITTPQRAKAAYQSIVHVAEQLFKQPKGEAFQRYRTTVLATLDFVVRDNLALQHLIGMTALDFSVYNHSINVGIFGIGLAKEIIGSKSDYNLSEVVTGFFLHDIGKYRIPRDILYKRGPLSRAEWVCVQGHVDEGLKILDEHGLLLPETEIVVSQHHERHDGSGYPKNLKTKEIHVFARICSIADMFDGLTSYRLFRKEHSSFEALKIMKNEMFRHFDPVFFQTFVKMFGKN